MNSLPAYTFERVSTAEQEHGFSPEAQRRNTSMYCDVHNLRVVKEFSFHETASNWKKRTKFIDMLEEAIREKIYDIVTDKIDRLLREYHGIIKIDEMLDLGFRFHFVRDNLILDKNCTSSERLRFNLQVTLAKYYVDNLRDEIQKGRHERIENGWYPGKPPIGYLNLRESKSKSIIIVDHDTASFVINAFELFSTGKYSYDSLHAELKRRCPQAFKASVPPGRRNLEKLLQNPFYYGAFRLKGELYKGKHPPLISHRLFHDVQMILRNRKGLYRSRERGKLEFIGFARCLKCNAAFTGEIKKNRHGKLYHYYRCSNPKCSAQKKVINEQNFLKLWQEPLRNLSYSPDMVRAFRDILVEHHKTELQVFQENIRELNTRHAEITARIHAAYDDKLRGQIPSDIFNDMYERMQLERNEVEAQLRSHNNADKEYIEFGLTLIELVSKCSDIYELSKNPSLNRQLLEIVLSNPRTDGLTIQYDYKKPFDLLAKIGSKQNWWRRRESNPRPQVIHCRAKLHA